MNEEQFNAITGGLETLGKAVAGLEEKFAAVPPADDPAPANAPKEGKQLTAEEMTQALALQVTDLGKDMEKKFTELSSRMAGEKPGTPAGETITPAADAQGKV